MVSFQDLIIRLENLGLYDVMLPFFLIFVLVFAILQKSKILHARGDEADRRAKGYDMVVALIIGALVVVPHVLGLYPANADVIVIMNTALPNIALVLVALLSLFLIVGLFGGRAAWVGKLTGWVALVAFVLVGYIFARAAGWFEGSLPNWLWWLEDPDTQALLIVVAVFAIIIWFITKEPPRDDAEGAFTKIGDAVGELFGKN
ncbi:MAG: hypothetical protein ACE5DM_00405 [Candidatus Nanoarchaeia archaeon]